MTTSQMIEAIIKMLAGLGLFLIGFKILSDNIEKIAGRKLKKMFNKTRQNRFLGVGVGALITAIIQSSSVTTVMVVGFVNSGIMDLFQATAVIMGANIGTTITAQIVALQSLNIITYLMLLTVIGAFINMLAKKEKAKTFGLVLAGFGIVFLSLKYMSNSMAAFAEVEGIKKALSSISNPFLLLLIGMALTAVLQSSAAVTTVIISMTAAGLAIGNGGNSVLFVVIGTNIGTCVTALLSSLGTNANAKRASLIHLMFNVFASLLFMTVLLIYKDFMDDTLAKWFEYPSTQIAMFHTFFNVISVLIFLPFINVFVKLSKLLVKDKEDKDKVVTMLDERFLMNPSIALDSVVKEVVRMGDLAMEALNISIDDFNKLSLENNEVIYKKIEGVDILQESILNYLIKLSTHDTTDKDEKMISFIHNAINDLNRLAEIADNMVKYTKNYIKNDLDFSPSIFNSIQTMKEKLDEQYKNVISLFSYNDFSVLENIDALEEEIDNMRSSLMDEHAKRLEAGKCKIQNSFVFINLVSNLERAGDHLNYIAHNFLENNK